MALRGTVFGVEVESHRGRVQSLQSRFPLQGRHMRALIVKRGKVFGVVGVVTAAGVQSLHLPFSLFPGKTPWCCGGESPGRSEVAALRGAGKLTIRGIAGRLLQ